MKTITPPGRRASAELITEQRAMAFLVITDTAFQPSRQHHNKAERLILISTATMVEPTLKFFRARNRNRQRDAHRAEC